MFRPNIVIGICHIACDIFQCVYNGFLNERKIMSYYTVTVEIVIKSDNEVDARDNIENYIDDLVSNYKNKDLQDYTIVNCISELEQV
jgi:hypothetical protein